MGNHISCTSVAVVDQRLRALSTIKFLHSETGAVSELDGRLSAAEAMLEFPAHFLCCLPSVPSSCRGTAQPRISAVPADEELQASQIYLLFPMNRLNMRFSLQEMALFASLQAAQHRSNGKDDIKSALSQRKVAPLPGSTGDSYTPQPSDSKGSTVLSRAIPFKTLQQGMDLSQGPASATTDMSMRAAKLRVGMMRRSKSWMPKLETVEEHVVAL